MCVYRIAGNIGHSTPNDVLADLHLAIESHTAKSTNFMCDRVVHVTCRQSGACDRMVHVTEWCM